MIQQHGLRRGACGARRCRRALAEAAEPGGSPRGAPLTAVLETERIPLRHLSYLILVYVICL